jgi:aminopeptidase-like protein/aminoglycoside N3'-acetyltransferase
MLAENDLIGALKQVGLCPGDTVFFQVSHDVLDVTSLGPLSEESCRWLLAAMRDVIGPEGTILMPSFSLSFYNNREFDVESTPAIRGEWSTSLELLEYFRGHAGVVRSVEPNYSVCGMGPEADRLLKELPNVSFGQDCLYERLRTVGGKICGIGATLAVTPFLHAVEEAVGVPFRYKKLFTGNITQNGAVSKEGWISTVPIQASNGLCNGTRVAEIARAEGLCRVAQLGDGEVMSIQCQTLYDLISREIARDRWITAQGPPGDPVELESERTRPRKTSIQVSANASMDELIAALWRLPRDIVSDGYDTALQALSSQVPMTIHKYPTGTECWTWLVPEKWTCHEAFLETMDGRRLFSYQDNPLHVVSYSLPINRVVSRENLFRHLHVHPELPEAIPFIFKYYERDWGLCCSQKLKRSMTEDHYRVVIDSNSSYGNLKVGEIVARGSSAETFVLCAHLCHPAMVNDDLSGVVVGLKVMQELLQRSDLHYTYRFLILPETIGSVAYLSHNEQLIPQMMGGLFLEMLGLNQPHALQRSFAGDTEVDRCLTRVLQEHDPRGWTGAFRTVVGNDERQFNAPGVRVPMLSLSRVEKSEPGKHPYYPQYHSSHDTPELAAPDSLAGSRDLVLKMIDAVEGNAIPVNRFKGEIFCSRYGLNVDVYTDREGNRALFDILFLIDGTRSEAEIARICNLPADSVRRLVEELRRLDLVEFRGANRN